MRFPLSLTLSMSSYLAGKTVSGALTGQRRYPLVLMLEPLHACNLTCTGCGRIREYKQTIRERLTVQECLDSVTECGAPIVSICGGEPLIYPGIGKLLRGTLDLGRHVYLCTNAMLVKRKHGEIRPHPRLIYNFHLDGMRKTHDLCVEQDGVFDAVIDAIKFAKAAGYRVCTNTTVFAETDMAEIEELFEFLKPMGVDGHMISPGYAYSAVKVDGLFMDRAMIRRKFADIDRLAERYNLVSSPIYLDFLAGRRELDCTAWGNPTRNVKGWKGPCYLMTDAHYATYRELIEKTDWSRYGPGRDVRCADCMMHCGFEPSAVVAAQTSVTDSLRMLAWQLS